MQKIGEREERKCAKDVCDCSITSTVNEFQFSNDVFCSFVSQQAPNRLLIRILVAHLALNAIFWPPFCISGRGGEGEDHVNTGSISNTRIRILNGSIFRESDDRELLKSRPSVLRVNWEPENSRKISVFFNRLFKLSEFQERNRCIPLLDVCRENGSIISYIAVCKTRAYADVYLYFAVCILRVRFIVRHINLFLFLRNDTIAEDRCRDQQLVQLLPDIWKVFRRWKAKKSAGFYLFSN